jgi:hypothetical protein
VQQQLTDQQQKTLYITRSGTTTTIAEKLVVETIEYTLDGTIQVTAFTDAYKNKLNDIIAEQPKILYRYNNVFTTNETGTASIGSATKTFSAQKVIQTTGNIKMYSGKLYCITGSLFISNLNYLQKLRYSITLLNDSTLINESVSYQSNAIFYNGASGAEFNEFTLLSAPFYFKALNNYTGDLKLQYVILHSVDSKTGTTVQFEGASTLVQIS